MRSIIHFLSACLLLLATTAAFGQMEYNATGGIALTPEVVGTVDLPDGNVLVKTMSSGFIWTNEEGIVGGNGSMDCSNFSTVGPEGDQLDGAGTCVGLDPDGDLWWSWATGAGEGEWGLTGGTGKYAGINGGGTWKVQVQFADGKVTNEWQGTWTIPAMEMASPEME